MIALFHAVKIFSRSCCAPLPGRHGVLFAACHTAVHHRRPCVACVLAVFLGQQGQACLHATPCTYEYAMVAKTRVPFDNINSHLR